MQKWSSNELRENYLRFFESKGHLRLPSASLVPANDPTLLLTGAGMVPFKPYFLGKEEPPASRITTCQRCLRTPDIDQVGKTARHATFFEMLGNFSFGDYFKEEAIRWAWEFTIEHLQLPIDKLWVTIYTDDDEAEQIWHQQIGVPLERIVRLGREDNFWEIGVGPCGPCSELHLDRGEERGCGRTDCKPGCDCDRFMEFWNLVFIQFYQDAEGNLTPLERTGIDTGMGLDRVACILQDVDNIFEIDLLQPILQHAAGVAGVTYGQDPKIDESLRVLTDHLRGVVFLIFDGVLPSNEGRGYVLRRLLRRAVRHARLLGITRPFLSELAQVVIDIMAEGYGEIVEKAPYIKQVIALEEERFHHTLDTGMSLLDEMIAKARSNGNIIAGSDAFKLYDTYGFPFELTREIAAEAGIKVDEQGFAAAMEAQRSRARAAVKQSGYLGDEDNSPALKGLVSQFVGYEKLEQEAQILGILVDGQSVEEITGGQAGEIIIDRTPFYAASGGQEADTGTLTGVQGQFQVEDVQQRGEVILHRGQMVAGALRVGDTLQATVDAQRRYALMRNHTATHLLHQALRTVLGDHVNQAGSLVSADRLRFDFTHFQSPTPEELAQVESIVNREILTNGGVRTRLMPIDKAKELGALALFGEKYGDEVRVVSVGDFSTELCGGTHVEATGEIGLFKILSEGSIAAGVRRIEAVTGYSSLAYLAERDRLINNLASRLETGPDDLVDKLERLLAEREELNREISRLRKEMAGAQADELLAQRERLGDFDVIISQVSDVDMDGLRQLGDRLRDKLSPGVVILASVQDEKVQLVAMASKELTKKGLHMGQIVKGVAPIVGGGGGGRPDMAQAGGKDPAKLGEALTQARKILQEQLEEGK
ncbi:MAG: alanine--tRNA ligase [Limnochordia bacterium]|jgi:alanyl-tRNA synthetase